MSYRITGLSPEPYQHLFGLSEDELAAHGAQRFTADKTSRFPDRIEVRDVAPGETVLLVNFTHQPADNPYRASHAIFVREGANEAYDRTDAIPDVLRVRTLSLRAFDAADMMVDAALVEGKDADASIARLFGDPAVAYIHAHYATRGCYAARIDRA